MGMFDYYRPKPLLRCPVCGQTLEDWQGKDGPNALFVWEQGCAIPTNQAVIDSMKCPDPADWALPDRFIIYSASCECERLVQAIGYCENEVWTRTELLTPDNAFRLPDESRSAFRARVEELRRWLSRTQA